jgi:tetratricopeptide (TPR) repeat protein
MELTLEQALQKGVEAHRAGKAQEAERYYATILKAQPKHPDANHNMGVLAVGVGKVEQALPFFKTSLEVNPSIAQFWLSYIDALIRLDRVDDAKVVCDQAKSKGVKSEAFNRLENSLNKRPGAEGSKVENPPQDQLEPLISLYNQGQLQSALDQALQLLNEFPSSTLLHNICGAVNAGFQKYDEAVNAYKQAIIINPNYPDAYNNMGVALKEQGKFEEAIEAYNKATSINPVYAEAYFNMGNALKDKGKLQEAIEAYNKATSINPDYAEAYFNMGNALKDKGKLQEAIEAYNKAISIKPDYAEAYNNLGEAHREAANFEQAKICFEEALGINPKLNKLGLSLALQGLGRYEEAIQAVVWKVNKPTELQISWGKEV